MLLRGEGRDTGEKETRHRPHHGATPRKCQLGFWRLVQALLGIYAALCFAVTRSLLGYVEQQVCWDHQHWKGIQCSKILSPGHETPHEQSL